MNTLDTGSSWELRHAIAKRSREMNVAYRNIMVSVSMLALALAGCNKSAQDLTATGANSAAPDSGLPPLPAALPMQTGPASPLTVAPPVSALPARRHLGLSRLANSRDAYAYLDRASDVQDEIGDAPPDYAYDNNDGVSPWVWETHGGDYRYAEPGPNGYRYYYYAPGADYPYLIRTHDYSYAYAGGALVAIYALSGALLPPDRYDGYRDQASRYFWRGQQLRQAAQQREHQGVVGANWAAQRAKFAAAQANWAAARASQADWQAYHAQHDPSQQPGWHQEYQQRQQVAQQFAGWQSRGLAGAAPAILAAAGAHAVMAQNRRPVAVPAPPAPAPALAGAPLPNAPALAGAPAPHAPGFAGAPMQRVPGNATPSHRPNLAGPQGTPVSVPTPGNAARWAAARDQQLAAQREAMASQRLARQAARAQQAAEAQRQAAAARQQQLAARSLAQQQALANQRTTLETARVRQQAAAQQQAAALQQARALRAQQQASRAREQAAAAQQQTIAMARHQQEMAAQEQAVAARQAQAHAQSAQHQAEIARAAALRPEARPPAVHVPAPHPRPSHEGEHHAP